MDGGRVEAVGTHRELLAGCPTYQRLYEARVLAQDGVTKQGETEPTPDPGQTNGKYKAA